MVAAYWPALVAVVAAAGLRSARLRQVLSLVPVEAVALLTSTAVGAAHPCPLQCQAASPSLAIDPSFQILKRRCPSLRIVVGLTNSLAIPSLVESRESYAHCEVLPQRIQLCEYTYDHMSDSKLSGKRYVPVWGKVEAILVQGHEIILFVDWNFTLLRHNRHVCSAFIVPVAKGSATR